MKKTGLMIVLLMAVIFTVTMANAEPATSGYEKGFKEPAEQALEPMPWIGETQGRFLKSVRVEVFLNKDTFSHYKYLPATAIVPFICVRDATPSAAGQNGGGEGAPGPTDAGAGGLTLTFSP